MAKPALITNLRVRPLMNVNGLAEHLVAVHLLVHRYEIMAPTTTTSTVLYYARYGGERRGGEFLPVYISTWQDYPTPPPRADPHTTHSFTVWVYEGQYPYVLHFEPPLIDQERSPATVIHDLETSGEPL